MTFLYHARLIFLLVLALVAALLAWVAWAERK
jgi:hypothetical protein